MYSFIIPVHKIFKKKHKEIRLGSNILHCFVFELLIIESMSKRKIQAIHRMFKSNPGLVILQFNKGSIIHQKKQTPRLTEHYRVQTG